MELSSPELPSVVAFVLESDVPSVVTVVVVGVVVVVVVVVVFGPMSGIKKYATDFVDYGGVTSE